MTAAGRLEPDMERVYGIGELFFRAPDPQALAAWYRDHLGIDPAPHRS